MPNCYDLASFILRERGEMTTFKLHKLVYYCQAWSLVWDDKPLFPERIEAWANGPVVPRLYDLHKGAFKIIKCSRGKPDIFDKEQRATIHAVLKYYGGKSSQWLTDLTHKEPPWRNARKGLGPSDRGNREISHASMVEYYSSL
ncbi:MAG: type II toxin-antitoxin system antitoxin SocA domain-containing protein [Desulfobaccales bacterium]|jgi:uncharacterized phage-associated protein